MFARVLNANDILIAHIQLINQYLYPIYHYVGDRIHDFLIGEVDLHNFKINEEAIRRAMLAENGVGVVRFGPAFYPFHAVFVSPKSMENCHKQLDTIMDLAEPEARCPYSFISYETGSSFFLSMNNCIFRVSSTPLPAENP